MRCCWIVTITGDSRSGNSMHDFSKEFISSGTFALSRAGDKVLYAVLGTCVGVALYDRHARAGGIIHLLLPEPTGITPSGPPATYASLGLPFFIEALCREGCILERLEAVVAGGALLGPVSQQDIDLDLGGRTTEIVFEILGKYRIPVVKSETGGFSGATLELNTRTWEASLRPVFPATSPSAKNRTPPSPAEIDAMIENVKPIPQIALKIIRLLREGDYSLKDLSSGLRSDQVLSARIIRFCNSVIMGAKKNIDSIDQAILLLGGGNLLEIVVSAAVETFFLQKEGGYSLMRGGLFKHAVGVANAARIISSFTGRSNGGTAYTAGLLHDIGKVVLDQHFMNSFALFYQNPRGDQHDFVKLEQAELKIDHLAVGRRLALRWQLSENLAEAIEFHHYPERAELDRDLVHIVYLADLLTSWYLAGLERERINTESFKSRLRQINLTPEQIPAIVDLIPWQRIGAFS